MWSIIARPAAGSSVSWHVTISDAFARNTEDKAAAEHEWWLYDARATFAGDGYSDQEARLWSRSGRLVACSRQLFADFAAPDRASA